MWYKSKKSVAGEIIYEVVPNGEDAGFGMQSPTLLIRPNTII